MLNWMLLCMLMLPRPGLAEPIPESDWPALCDSILSNNKLIHSGSGSLVYEYVLHDSVRARERMQNAINERFNNQNDVDYMSLPDSLRPAPQYQRPVPTVTLVTHKKVLYRYTFMADQSVDGYLFLMPARLEAETLLDEPMGVMKQIYTWDGEYMQRLIHNKASDGSVRVSGSINNPSPRMADVAEFNFLYYTNGMFEIALHSQNMPGGVPKITGCSQEMVGGEPRITLEISTTHPLHPEALIREVYTVLPEQQYRPVRIESETIDTTGQSPGAREITTIIYQNIDGYWIPKRIELNSFGLLNGETVPNITRILELQDGWSINIPIDPAVFTIEFPEGTAISDYNQRRR